MGHAYLGVVEQVGDEVRSIKPDHFVVGSFFASDNTAEICLAVTRPRVRSKAAFATLAGASLIPASSSKTNRHRFNG